MQHSQLRSKQGCWTCRSRKKKCDEGKPICENCQSLSLVCHGYGPRPEWMDDEVKQKAFTEELKTTVRLNAKRRSRARPDRGDKSYPELLPRETSDAGPSSARSSSSAERTLASRPRSDDESNPTGYSLSAKESIFLMYYMDQTFPFLYPMYTPHPQEGGRGWLLQLLLRSKPFFQAVLAVGSYHNFIDLSHQAPYNRGCPKAAAMEHQERLDTCLKQIQSSFREATRLINAQKNRYDLIASMVQLVFLELFISDIGSWQVHLLAAIEMFKKVNEVSAQDLSRRLEPIVCLRNDEQSAISQDSMTFLMLAGTLVWLDLLATISNGTAPKLSLPSLETIHEIRMPYIMGCENWVIIQISRTAEMFALQRSDSLMDIESKASDIAHKLREGFEKMQQPTMDVDLENSPYANRHVHTITTIFAYAASIYLRLIYPGIKDQLLDDITYPLSLIESHLDFIGSNIGWPLFIFGCVAKGQHQESIRRIYQSPNVSNPTNPLRRHRHKVMPILEDIWAAGNSGETAFEWVRVVELVRGHLIF